MRAVFGLVLVVGVALAGGAVMMAKNYIERYQTALAQEQANRTTSVPTVAVFVANETLSYGQRLTKESVRAVAWPKNALPEGVFSDEATLFPSEKATDARYVLRTMERNEPLMAVKVTAPGEDAGITSRLEKGMRAFAIRVDVASGVSGFLRPGDRVDVYWSGQPPARRGQDHNGEVTRLIQTNIELIAVDQIAGSDFRDAVIARTVTVKALPEQVATLAQAQSTGRLTLSLVGAEDDTIASLVEVDQRALFGLGELDAPVQAEEKRVCTIRTRRGADVVDIPIPCSD
ncbi:Flp pilus assembly protein CpaB [Tritonibacter scottomollicae]|uniref:Pilus assembly protein CpaB n=1 Tax=Tritonibacter scottomollicae TaxID=483013 RepID=A0A2T1ANZ5_TRISK|nr:Flp pilus assembly protein CpaB [Tritonibacter scottomollicae]PRZ50331.1 pilus assembly protein CpaB [Tritonibacter scottomollicae]